MAHDRLSLTTKLQTADGCGQQPGMLDKAHGSHPRTYLAAAMNTAVLGAGS